MMTEGKLLRHTLIRTSAIGVDWVICKGLSREPTPEVHESETKIIVPLSGRSSIISGAVTGTSTPTRWPLCRRARARATAIPAVAISSA